MPKPTPEKQTELSHKKVGFFVKLFVAFHVVAITAWAIPLPKDKFFHGTVWKLDTSSPANFAESLNDGIRVKTNDYLRQSPMKYYVLATGFWQYWDMFAPNPADTDFYGSAVITYKDGSKATYTYPRMYDLGIIAKYEKERFRKFYERAHDDNYQYLWRAFAQRIAFLNDDKPNNPPIEVDLYRHWLVISPPGKPQATTYQSYLYQKVYIDPVVLRDAEEGMLHG